MEVDGVPVSVASRVASGGGCQSVSVRAAIFDEVVVEHAVAAPGSWAVRCRCSGSVEPEVTHDAVDLSLAAGAPSDELAERAALLDLAMVGVGFAFRGGSAVSSASTINAERVLDQQVPGVARLRRGVGRKQARRAATRIRDQRTSDS